MTLVILSRSSNRGVYLYRSDEETGKSYIILARQPSESRHLKKKTKSFREMICARRLFINTFATTEFKVSNNAEKNYECRQGELARK